MLPVIIYETVERNRAVILDYLNQYSVGHGRRLSVMGSATSLSEAASCIDASGGILLLIIGVANGAGGGAVELEYRASHSNRDSYSLYWLQAMGDLPEIAVRCLRPSGFILPPPDYSRFETMLTRICDDYEAISGEVSETFLSLQYGGEMFRLSVGAIDYIEALDKKINIWTGRQCVTVYETLSRMEEQLGERFFRCHRSYLVNYEMIESVDFAGMELQLRNGIRLPISRSAKERLRDRMRKEKPES